jgi:hypothetical protein
MNVRVILTCFFLLIFSFTAIAQSQATVDTSELKIFEKVDVEASFPGGDMAWRKFLEHNLRGDVAAENGTPVGKYTVWVQFIVDKDGHIGDVKELTNNGYGMEKEVVRLIKSGPQWQPASQDGRRVKAYRKQPVTFMIEDDGFEIISQEPYVFYTGIDNLITISANKVKPDDLQVTISQGSIFPKGDGSYVFVSISPAELFFICLTKKIKKSGPPVSK